MPKYDYHKVLLVVTAQTTKAINNLFKDEKDLIARNNNQWKSTDKFSEFKSFIESGDLSDISDISGIVDKRVFNNPRFSYIGYGDGFKEGQVAISDKPEIYQCYYRYALLFHLENKLELIKFTSEEEKDKITEWIDQWKLQLESDYSLMMTYSVKPEPGLVAKIISYFWAESQPHNTRPAVDSHEQNFRAFFAKYDSIEYPNTMENGQTKIMMFRASKGVGAVDEGFVSKEIRKFLLSGRL
jgi:hypothetical protein